MPCKLLVAVFHQMIPRRKASASGMRKCSSSNNVNPPGPRRHDSSPVLARPFGAERLGSNFTLSDHSPTSALVRLSISGEGCGAVVSDWAHALPPAMHIPQIVREQNDSKALLDTVFICGSFVRGSLLLN